MTGERETFPIEDLIEGSVPEMLYALRGARMALDSLSYLYAEAERYPPGEVDVEACKAAAERVSRIVARYETDEGTPPRVPVSVEDVAVLLAKLDDVASIETKADYEALRAEAVRSMHEGPAAFRLVQDAVRRASSRLRRIPIRDRKWHR